MKFLQFVVLAALWGASYVFMRIAAPEFGPLLLIALRLVFATVFLGLLLWGRGFFKEAWAHRRDIALLGLLNSTLPFCLIAYASLSIPSGISSLLNATSPIWGYMVAWWWLQEKPRLSGILGLALGLGGIALLANDPTIGLTPANRGPLGWLPLVASLCAAVCYGLGANVAKKRLQGVHPMAIALGNLVAASLFMAPALLLSWPQGASSMSLAAWVSVVGLGIGSTALAYMIYFRLIATVGPSKAISVTFLVPVFGVLWGAMILNEPVTPRILAGGAIVLLGTSLATGLVGQRRVYDWVRGKSRMWGR